MDVPVEQSTNATADGRPGWFGRHKAATALVFLCLVLLALVVGWATYLNSQIARIPRVDAGIQPRVDADGGGTSTRGSLNILLGGTDSPRPGELAELVRSGWEPGAMRADIIMVLHITEDRDRAYLVSIPRDTWTAVPGYGEQKINAAFSYGGPKLYVRTVERFTGLHIDHLAVIDWEGFKDLTKAIGGVDVVVPQTVTDTLTEKTWHEGRVHLEGEDALAYVRQRYGLPNGDFDRINRQQNVLRAVMAKLVSKGTMLNPIRLSNAVQTLSGFVTLDSTFGNSEVRELALSLRGLRVKDATFVTVPLNRYASIRGQSVVLVDPDTVRDLFEAVDSDDLEAHVEDWEDSVLPPPAKVP